MNKRTRSAAWGFGVFGIGAALSGLGTYPLFLRRRCLTWGARPDEVSRKLPGDELLPRAGIVATRAITIDAPPAAIWPWLVQMGSGRGGVYTYDWIENLFGLDMHSTRRILPQYQGVKAGDEFPLGPGRPAMRGEGEGKKLSRACRAARWRSGRKTLIPGTSARGRCR